MEPKKNCWEVKKCERQPDGAKVEELGVCPSSTPASMKAYKAGPTAEDSAGASPALFAAANHREQTPRKPSPASAVNSFSRSYRKRA